MAQKIESAPTQRKYEHHNLVRMLNLSYFSFTTYIHFFQHPFKATAFLHNIFYMLPSCTTALSVQQIKTFVLLQHSHTETCIGFSLLLERKWQKKNQEECILQVDKLASVLSIVETAKVCWIYVRIIPVYCCQGQSALCTGLASRSSLHKQWPSAVNFKFGTLFSPLPSSPQMLKEKHTNLVLL